MARRGTTSPRPAADDALGWSAFITGHLGWMRLRGLSPNTVYGRQKALDVFVAWCTDRSIAPTTVTAEVLDGYRRHLYRRQTAAGVVLAVRAQQQYLIAVRQLYAWAAKQKHVACNPAADLDLPKTPDRLPRRVLDIEQVEAVLATPDLTTLLGVRDRVMLEVLYATGIRRAELANLHVADINLGKRTVFVREGKGCRDRIVPLGERATVWVGRYLTDTRPLLLAADPNEPALFLTRDGTPLCLAHVGALVSRYLRAGGVGEGGAHVFRHTMATLMLEGGADVRWVQAMLGHRSITSTAIYTHVDITGLAQVHAATHPGTSNQPRTTRQTAPETPPAAVSADGDTLAAVVVPLRQRVDRSGPS